MLLNPVMLAGLGGALVPLILHLLARARYRTIDWGAMMFLEGLDARQTQSLRIRQWLLLLLRMAMVALLAVALARPVVRGRWAVAAGTSNPTAVIVLDCSYSMGYMEGGRSRFELARDAVRQILWSLEKGTEVSLILQGDDTTILYPQPTSNLQNVARDLDSVSVSAGKADIASAVAEARKILDQPSRSSRELYIVTDRQAVNWKQFDPHSESVAWLRDARRPTRCYVIPVGGTETDNVAIESVQLVDGVAIRGQSAEVEIRVKNFSSLLRPAMDITLSVLSPSDGAMKLSDAFRKIKTANVTIPARSSATVRIPATFSQTGSHVLSAEIDSPGLEIDNRFDAAIDVVDPIQVLILSGDESGPPQTRESYFLKLALSPYESVAKKSGDPFKVTVKGAEEATSLDLSPYQVIILANIPTIGRDLARVVEQRVYEGCGLIICPGNLTRVDNFNERLWRDGGGVSPASLSPALPPEPSRATTLLGLELKHPIFRFRRGADPLPNAVIARYFPAAPRPADARVLATLASGDPFLVEAAVGRGKALLLTSPLDANWNTLPLYPFFLPFVQSMTRYAAPTIPSRNVAPGETLVASFDEPFERADIIRNDDKPIAVGSLGRSMQVRFTDTTHPGIYRLLARVGRNTQIFHFVVQPPRSESDLTPLTEARWEELAAATPFDRLYPARQAIKPILAADRNGRELWLVLLLAAVLAGAMEMVLASRWSTEGGA